MLDKIKRLDVFAIEIGDPEWNAVVHKKNKIVQEDELIAITTSLVGALNTTSYEKVAALEETENTLSLCLTSCSENIINGYYRFQLKYDVNKQQIQLKYSKIQSLTTLPLRMLVSMQENTYIEYNKLSIVNTFNHLFGENILSLADVKYNYK